MATTFYNQATLSYNGISTTSNTVTGEIIDTLTVTKNVLTDTYNSDSTLTYVVNLINTGPTALTSLTLSDDLGAYDYSDTTTLTPLTYLPGTIQYYVNGVLQTTPTVTDQSPLTVTGVNIPAGGNAALIYQASVNEFASPEAAGNITNTATVTGDGLVSAVTASRTVTPSGEPILSINKAVSPTSVSENGELTYTFTIENIGNTDAEATDNVSVTDVLSPVLDSLVVTLNGAPLTLGTDYTYDTDTGTLVTTPGRITVPAATYTQNPTTGAWSVTPGSTVLTVTGTV